MCTFCGKISDEKTITEHEVKCSFNPQNRTCLSCINCLQDSYSISVEGNTYKGFTCKFDDEYKENNINLGKTCKNYKAGNTLVVFLS